MKRTDGPGHASNLYTEGNPGLGIPATTVQANSMNALQEEIALFIESRNITLNPADSTQLSQAILDLVRSVTKMKDSVRVATTTNGTLATAFANGQTVDGVVLATGNRILIKNQTVQTENGIYTVNASGAPTRATDFDLWSEIVAAAVTVETGTVNAGMQYICSVLAGGTVGSTNITFIRASAANGAITLITATGTWTKSALAPKYIKVRLVGGGGGGGGVNATGAGQGAEGAGGGGGGYSEKIINASALGATETVTVGAGGAGGANTGGTGGTGGTTSFGSHLSATGGTGGPGMTATAGFNIAIGGTGGTGSSGNFNVDGTAGFNGYSNGGVVARQNRGGNSLLSPLSLPSTGGAGSPGINYGGGGSGASILASGAAVAGGAGAAGVVIVEEFY